MEPESSIRKTVSKTERKVNGSSAWGVFDEIAYDFDACEEDAYDSDACDLDLCRERRLNRFGILRIGKD